MGSHSHRTPVGARRPGLGRSTACMSSDPPDRARRPSPPQRSGVDVADDPNRRLQLSSISIISTAERTWERARLARRYGPDICHLPLPDPEAMQRTAHRSSSKAKRQGPSRMA